MTKHDPSLRRGEEDTRSHFERARDDFNDAEEFDQRVVQRVDTDTDNGGCPTCHAPMMLIHTYRQPDRYRFEGRCSKDAKHDIERFGYFATTDGTTVGGGVDPKAFERKGDQA